MFFWNNLSFGSHFDLGVTYALEKNIKLISLDNTDNCNKKTYMKVLFYDKIIKMLDELSVNYKYFVDNIKIIYTPKQYVKESHIISVGEYCLTLVDNNIKNDTLYGDFIDELTCMVKKEFNYNNSPLQLKLNI